MTRSLADIRRILQQPGFAGLLATSFALGLASSFVTPFISLWGTTEVGMRPLVFGLFMMTTAVSGIVLNLGLARWSDTRLPRRYALLLSSAGGVIGYLGYAFVRNVPALIAIGALAIGLAYGSLAQLFAHMREELRRPEHAAANAQVLMSVLRASFSLAWMVGPALSAAVVLHLGFRGIFVAAAGLYVLFFLGVMRFVPNRPRGTLPTDVTREPLRKVLTQPVILAHFAAFVLVFAAFTMNMMNLPLVITHLLGGTAREVGITFGVAPVFEVPLMIWFGHLATHRRQAVMIRYGVAIGVVYFLALTLAHTPWQIYPMQILSAASIAVTTNVTITFFQDLLPGHTGVATSLYSNAFSSGGLTGYLAFGTLVNTVGHRGLFHVCALLCLTSLAVLLVARRYIVYPAAGAHPA